MAAMPSGFATLRDALLFLLGAGILVWTLVIREGPVDVVAVGTGVALLGLPMVTLAPRLRDERQDSPSSQ